MIVTRGTKKNVSFNTRSLFLALLSFSVGCESYYKHFHAEVYGACGYSDTAGGMTSGDKECCERNVDHTSCDDYKENGCDVNSQSMPSAMRSVLGGCEEHFGVEMYTYDSGCIQEGDWPCEEGPFTDREWDSPTSESSNDANEDCPEFLHGTWTWTMTNSFYNGNTPSNSSCIANPLELTFSLECGGNDVNGETLCAMSATGPIEENGNANDASEYLGNQGVRYARCVYYTNSNISCSVFPSANSNTVATMNGDITGPHNVTFSKVSGDLFAGSTCAGASWPSASFSRTSSNTGNWSIWGPDTCEESAEEELADPVQPKGPELAPHMLDFAGFTEGVNTYLEMKQAANADICTFHAEADRIIEFWTDPERPEDLIASEMAGNLAHAAINIWWGDARFQDLVMLTIISRRNEHINEEEAAERILWYIEERMSSTSSLSISSNSCK